MSSFTKPLVFSPTEDGMRFTLTQEFSYYRVNNPEEVITVPVGYTTDLASIPRIFWVILPPQGQYIKAAVIHDYLCDLAKTDDDYMYADQVFYEAMRVSGVSYIKAKIMYLAVRSHHKISY
jgi:hypothetical protein